MSERPPNDEPASPAGTSDLPGQAASRDSARVRALLGSIGLFLGIGILLLRLVDAPDLPLRMPRSWYVDRTAWVAAGLLALAAGWHLLRDDEAAKRPTPFNRVVLYTRRGCHLCEEVRATLAAQGERLPPIIEVDIDDDDDAALKQRFSDCVPVVEIDGKIRFRGRVNPVLLRRLITAKSSQRPGTA